MFDTMFARDVQQSLDHFRRSVDQLFPSTYGSVRPVSSPQQGDTEVASEVAFSPAVESGWSEHALHLRCILPGVHESDVQVNVVGNQLRIEGERKVPEMWTKVASPRLFYGRFQTALTLPQGLNLDQVSCRLQDGVLDIAIPVAERMKPRQVRIETGETQKVLAS